MHRGWFLMHPTPHHCQRKGEPGTVPDVSYGEITVIGGLVIAWQFML